MPVKVKTKATLKDICYALEYGGEKLLQTIRADKGTAAMNDNEVSARLEEVAKTAFNPVNQWAVASRVSDILKVVEALTVHEFSAIRDSVFGTYKFEGEVGPMTPLPQRLEKLSRRLEADGLYVDADIVHQAFDKIRALQP